MSSVNLRRAFGGEDWRAYNRLSLWIKPEVRGFPMLPLQIVLHNDGAEKVPDKYYREGIHYVTLANNQWTQVVWEIEPLARDRVTAIEIGYWVNKMLALPGDTVAFEIGRIELQQVTPEAYTGSIHASMPGLPATKRLPSRDSDGTFNVGRGNIPNAASCARRESCRYRFTQPRAVLPLEAE